VIVGESGHNISADSAARTALSLATVDPRRALAMAAEVDRVAVAAGDFASRSIAFRAAGTAAHQLGDLVAATAALHSAVKAGRKAGAQVLVAEARADLAGIYCRRGWPARALREIGAALNDVHGIDAARVRTRRAAIAERWQVLIACTWL